MRPVSPALGAYYLLVSCPDAKCKTPDKTLPSPLLTPDNDGGEHIASTVWIL